MIGRVSSMRVRARQPRPGRSQTILAIALALTSVLAVTKSALLIQEVRVQSDSGAGAEGLEAGDESLPEPAAGPGATNAGADPGSGPECPPGDSSARVTLDPALLDASEREILEMIADRRAALDERERELELRAAVLETAETRLAEQVEQLAQLHAAITTAVNEHDAAEAEKLASLVKIYETMKPKAAAEIFDRLDVDVLLRVVSQMGAAKSSAVIARMSPQRAEQLTAALAKLTELPRASP